jgi:hypothetical protein
MLHFLFIQQIYILNTLNMLHTLRFFSSSKCRLFHNATFLGSCIIHILYTECAKILKKIPAHKGLIMDCTVMHTDAIQNRYLTHLCESQNDIQLDHKLLYQMIQSRNGRNTNKVNKGIPRQAEVALGVPGRLRPRIFSTCGTTRVAGRQPNSPAAFTPGEIPGTHFQRLSRPQGTWFCRKELWKKSPVTPPGSIPGPSD